MPTQGAATHRPSPLTCRAAGRVLLTSRAAVCAAACAGPGPTYREGRRRAGQPTPEHTSRCLVALTVLLLGDVLEMSEND